ncbi:acetyltransferase [Clostridium zeae]|uniref:Acetyltransferase n=1 Tax=Clostridium zeae TaxID=2759022 RepID=A0ABQ1E9D0_9CLOT|nr:GNAT family N-acetyltransferase [Clostridium zeae]GFZ31415.1 acetyltransferase [Clostridium zeae]
MRNIQIREIKQMSEYDLSKLALLLMDVVEDGASVGFLSPISLKVAKEYWISVLSKGVMIWIAEIEGAIVGTIQLHLCQKQNGRHRGEIAKLMVHSSVRRCGVGKKLMEISEKRAIAEGISLITLDTRSGDASNLLYKSFEYIEVGKIPNYAESTNGQLHETTFYYKKL